MARRGADSRWAFRMEYGRLNGGGFALGGQGRWLGVACSKVDGRADYCTSVHVLMLEICVS